MGIGSRLKEAREEKDISLDSLQETTKIQKRYLRAIEEENFDILPGKFYARAFIKEYALAVNLDVDELFEEFKDDLPQPEEETETQYTRVQRSRKESNISKNSPLFSLIPTIIVVLLIIGIIFAIWFFMLGGSSDSNEVSPAEEENDNEIIRGTDENESQSEDKASGDEQSEQDDEGKKEDEDNDDSSTDDEGNQDLELKVVDEDENDKSETSLDLNNVQDELTLTLESSGETWLEIENGDGEQLYYGILADADSPLDLDVADEKELYFSVGNASVLDMQFNDLDFEYPLNPSENVVQKFWVNIN